MEVLVVQENGSRLWRQHQRPVGAPCQLAGVGVEQEHKVVFRPGFVDTLAVQVRVPFVAGALGGEQACLIGGTLKHGHAIRIRARDPADIGCKHVADTRQRGGGIYRVRGQDLRAWQPAPIILGIKPRGNAELPEVTRAERIAGLGFRTGERRQQQAGQNADNRDHHEQLNQREACRFFIHGSMGVVVRFCKSSTDFG